LVLEKNLKKKEDVQSVIIVTTGGTIDKSYDEFEGTLGNRETFIKEQLLSKLRLPYTYLHVFSVFSKDSLNLTDYDRTLLVKTISTQMEKGDPIVILHGTDTMSRSAEQLQKELKNVTVPIVFTGAMKPMGFDDSDARQNVTEALLVSKIIKPGIYISFHNQVFPVPGVRKNKTKGTFEFAK
jgi:L-asparaginase